MNYSFFDVISLSVASQNMSFKNIFLANLVLWVSIRFFTPPYLQKRKEVDPGNEG